MANAEKQTAQYKETSDTFAETHFKPLKQKCDDALNQVNVLTKQNQALEDEKQALQAQLNKSKAEASEERKRKSELEKEIAQLRLTLAQVQKPVNIEINSTGSAAAPSNSSPTSSATPQPSTVGIFGLFNWDNQARRLNNLQKMELQ